MYDLDRITENAIDVAVNMTNTYKKYKDSDPITRNVKVLACMYPYGLYKMKNTDFFAGNSIGNFVYMDFLIDCAPYTANQVGYVMKDIDMNLALAEKYPHRADEIKEIIEYWKTESTFKKNELNSPEEVHEFLHPFGEEFYDKHGYRRIGPCIYGSGTASGSYDTRLAGIMPNFDRLMKVGIVGLEKITREYLEQKPEHEIFYKGVLECLEIAKRTCEWFRNQAIDLAEKETDNKYRKNLLRTAEVLENIQKDKPKTLHEGIQLMLIFSILTRTQNFGRMDVFLGDLLTNDLEKGTLSRIDAQNLIVELWKTLSNICDKFDTRVYIGGKGRRNEKNADVFALMAIEATMITHDIKPVLSLRLYDGQNEELFKKALEAISQGCIYPTLYNDEYYIDATVNGMDIPYEDALDYAALGCGELLVAGCSTGSPNSTERFLKMLELVLHNGKDFLSGKLFGIQTGTLDEFDTYEKLEEAVKKQINYALNRDVKVHLWNRDFTKNEYPATMESILMDDCLERGKGIFDGGIRYFGANVEGFGITNLANSLYVIKKVVYDNKEMTLKKLVEILDKNYEGYEDIRRRFLHIPKFGNNVQEVDEFKLRIEKYINQIAYDIGKNTDLAYYTVASVNPGGINLGAKIAATPDGRKLGEIMAVGNSPYPGSDKNGITSMLTSVAKYTDTINGGYVTNMNISRETMINDRNKVYTLFKTYFDMGGSQLNVNCFSRGDLEKALENPEQYSNLIVRVSGYSARFIDLDERTQKAIMARTVF